MLKLGRLGMAGVVLAFCAAMATTSYGQTYTTLLSFEGSTGVGPQGSLIQGIDGNFYGVDSADLFRLTPEGALTLIPTASPVGISGLSIDGSFYGTMLTKAGVGTVVEVTTNGQMTTLYSFGTGVYPGPLTVGSEGDFYGIAEAAGDSSGSFFKLSPAGALTTVFTLMLNSDQCLGPFIEGTDGNFYGTTDCGTVDGRTSGTIFKITRSGVIATLHSFKGPDGLYPRGGLVEGADGNFYGAAYLGGIFHPLDCEEYGCGTIFKMTPAGEFTTLYRFCGYEMGRGMGCPDGYWPISGLVQGNDGNFYGVTQGGGTSGGQGFGSGTIFKITPQGDLTTLHSFDGTDGSGFLATLMQSTDGNFYGTSYVGGANYLSEDGVGGVAFSLSVGLPPFVEALPTSGTAGSTVMILGNNLTGTSSVSFGDTEADFTVVSDTEILATVPEHTGRPTVVSVSVTTPNGVLRSNVPFHVALTGWLQ
jgi:uncharacterized repeat protein (TIGR03803 family)